jgi:hypothetical protein
LAQGTIVEPELPIVDPHHHLWDRPGWRYLLDDQALSMYRATAPRKCGTQGGLGQAAERGLNEHTNGLFRQYFPKGCGDMRRPCISTVFGYNGFDHAPMSLCDFTAN